MRKITEYVFFAFLLLFSSVEKVYAEEKQFINIVNLVRTSGYTKNVVESIKAQHEIVLSNELAASWLITYDILQKERAVDLLRSFSKDQEIGIFMEISPSLAQDSGVEYNDTGAWHYSTSIFLSGYAQEDRKNMIDTFFEVFKEKFGFYPKSVGAWWIDSYSLEYMHEKYRITTNLGVADQYSTDNYQVWGTYWSTPYYPSKYHAGIPAGSINNKLDIVTIQWASRDPLNGYYSSLYSTQDYKVADENLTVEYFEKMVGLYAYKHDNQFGQITIGLESDLNPKDYQGEYKKQIEVVKKLSDQGEIAPVTMSDFAQWYKSKFPGVSPKHLVASDDLLGGGKKVFWYQSPNYRIGLQYDSQSKDTKIFDLRNYYSDFQEPYYISPNNELDLSIYIPSLFDEVNNKDNTWRLSLGEYSRTESDEEQTRIVFNSGQIILTENSITIEGGVNTIPDELKLTGILVTKGENKVEIIPDKKFSVDQTGYQFRDLTDVATRVLKRRRNIIILIILFTLFLFLSTIVIRSEKSDRIKLFLLSLLIIPSFIVLRNWYMRNTEKYYVSQSEIDALQHLAILPKGDVLVYDNECLGCQWSSEKKPAAFANKRGYVMVWGKYPIVYNSSVFEAKDQKVAKEEFDKLNVDYIYLAKYENYIEKIPFSPGDLGIEKVYDNANTEVWKIKN